MNTEDSPESDDHNQLTQNYYSFDIITSTDYLNSSFIAQLNTFVQDLESIIQDFREEDYYQSYNFFKISSFLYMDANKLSKEIRSIHFEASYYPRFVNLILSNIWIIIQWNPTSVLLFRKSICICP